jgi:ankyrin repeat protein
MGNCCVSEVGLVEALRRGDIKILRKWTRRGNDRKLVSFLQMQAASHGLVEGMRILVNDLGAHTDSNLALMDVDGVVSALRLAALHGQLDMVRYLVTELGMDVEIASSSGMTPLLHAVSNGHLDVVRCLDKEYNADIHTAAPGGRTILRAAILSSDLDMMRLLVKKLGADINHAHVADYGFTPLHFAA